MIQDLKNLKSNYEEGGTGMSEKELDSSINDYIETEMSENYVKKLQWDMLLDFKNQII